MGVLKLQQLAWADEELRQIRGSVCRNGKEISTGWFQISSASCKLYTKFLLQLSRVARNYYGKILYLFKIN